MVNLENYEEYMMMYADGELNEVETKALMDFVAANPELAKELEAYSATKLVPDTTMVYANKDQLMKAPPAGGRTIGMRTWWMYAAAAAVLLFTVTIMRQGGDTADSPVVVSNTPATTQPVSTQPTQTPVTDHKTEKDSNREELHSNPVSPVTHENNIAKKEKTESRKQRKTVEEQPKEEIKIAKEERPAPQQPAYKPENEPVQQVIAQQTEKPNKVEEVNQPTEEVNNQPEKQRRRLIDLLPISKSKKEGASMIASAVTKRVENVTDNLKDTDIKFKIGNKEIFVVKL
eukprot:GILI01035357.1.p1 GENE.GILI01035357.1~~GILI01035357.1.p1  ORF type:complete len:288 (+),score=20.02 GILI01035357.1:130-993(+)